MNIGIDLQGVNDLLNRLKTYGATVQLEAKQEVQATAFDIQADMVRDARVDTGNLRQLIVAEPADNDWSYKIHSKASYSAYVEFGTRAHDIYAKNKRVLSNGTKIFGTVVHHPGTQPRPFFWDNFYKGAAELKGRLQLIIERAGNTR